MASELVVVTNKKVPLKKAGYEGRRKCVAPHGPHPARRRSRV